MDKKKVLAQVNNLHLKYEQSDESLFENLNFSILQKDKIGIIGPNGIGKTSLLKIIANEVTPTKGKVYNSSKIGYIHQINPNKRKSNQSISEYLSHQSEFWWDIPTQYKKIFKTRLPVEINLKDLSGGEFARLSLAIITAFPLDLLILDEPTNNLDIETLDIFASALNNYDGALIIISHNKGFLNEIGIDRYLKIENRQLKICNTL